MKGLRERFESFVQTLNGFENIDTLLKGADPKDKKRADYFLDNRKIIIEQKVLQVDPKDKPQKFADRLMKQRGILAYGTTSTRQLFSRQPDGEALQRALMLKIGKVIEDNIANADKQTKDTRDIFEVPEALGILIILNEGAGMLTPDIIGYSIFNAIQKKRSDGSLRYTQNDGVLIISEAQSMSMNGCQAVFPIIGVNGLNKSKDKRVCAFLDTIQPQWAKFNNVPYFEGGKEVEAILKNSHWNTHS